MMSKQDIFEIAVKLFGIYCFVEFLGSLPLVGIAFSTDQSLLAPNVTLQRLSFCSIAFLHLMASLLLLFKGKAIAHMLAGVKPGTFQGKEEAVPPYARLSFWIILIGIFYFVSSAAKLVFQGMQYSATYSGVYWWSETFSQAVIFALAVVFIIGSKGVENFIQGKPARDT